MEANYDIFEIVTVIHDFWLVDAKSYQRSYCTKHGRPLAPGCYIVNWPGYIPIRRFDEHASFFGPFKLLREAQAALAWIHQEQSRVLTVAPITAPHPRRMALKKTSLQDLATTNQANRLPLKS